MSCSDTRSSRNAHRNTGRASRSSRRGIAGIGSARNSALPFRFPLRLSNETSLNRWCSAAVRRILRLRMTVHTKTAIRGTFTLNSALTRTNLVNCIQSCCTIMHLSSWFVIEYSLISKSLRTGIARIIDAEVRRTSSQKPFRRVAQTRTANGLYNEMTLSTARASRRYCDNESLWKYQKYRILQVWFESRSQRTWIIPALA